MRQRFALLWLAVTAAIAGIASYFSYEAGLSNGLASKLPAGAAPYYWYGPHWGGGGFFPLFGFFWFLLFLFVIFAVFRGFARMGRWGGGHHGGNGPHSMEDRLRDWHKQAHEEEPKQ
ncbi:MAG TPA: hypothetical protein VF137_06900 [Candidatus Dormibacteraeota bacterium]